MKDRIKSIRKSKRLSQEEFGSRIGITKSSVSLLESGRNSPSEQTIKLLCTEFNVNEDWLRTGAGGDENMFILKLSAQSLDELAQACNATESDYQLIRNYLSLDPLIRKQLLSIFQIKE